MILQAILAASFTTVALGSICCTPKQWEGFQIASGGYVGRLGRPGEKNGYYQVSYDATNKKVAVSGNFTRRDKVRPFKTIYDFKEDNSIDGRGHLIFPEEETCTSFPLRKEFREACIPDTATYGGSSYFGVGENMLNVKAYEVKREGRGADVSAVVFVTSDGCVPVVENVWGSVRRVSFFGSVNFLQLTAGIQDPAVFSPPEYCEEGTVEMLDELQTQYGILQQ